MSTEIIQRMRKCKKLFLENFMISVKLLVGFWQKEAKGKPKVKQYISMEAKKPRFWRKH